MGIELRIWGVGDGQWHGGSWQAPDQVSKLGWGRVGSYHGSHLSVLPPIYLILRLSPGPSI